MVSRDAKSWAIGTGPRWRAPTGELDLLLRATFARSCSTLGALHHLAVHGYGVQARMLCRPLLEDLLVSTYLTVADDREDVVHRYTHHYALVRAQARGAPPSLELESELRRPHHR